MSKIVNYNLPVCKNCMHFMKSKHMDDLTYGVCKLFGEKNIITGEIKYKYADMTRMSEKLCGINGKYFAHIPKDAPIKNLAITENEFLSKFY